MNSLITAKTAYNENDQLHLFHEQLLIFNANQYFIYNTIIQTINLNSQQTHFFL